MGKGKDKDNKRGGEKKFASSSEEIESRSLKQNKHRGMPPDSESEEEEDEGEVVPVRQNKNAGMMPPSDDEEESEEEEDSGPVATPAEMMAFIKSKGLDGELKAWLKSKAQAAKSGKPMAGYELSKAEAAKKKEEEEEESEEEPDPEVLKRLEIVKKRREEQREKRLAADGWDRLAPMSADNHPPGTAWPPPEESTK